MDSCQHILRAIENGFIDQVPMKLKIRNTNYKDQQLNEGEGWIISTNTHVKE
jgi:hypothetical protein